MIFYMNTCTRIGYAPEELVAELGVADRSPGEPGSSAIRRQKMREGRCGGTAQAVSTASQISGGRV